MAPDAYDTILEAIREPFGLTSSAVVAPLGNGHINVTVLVSDGERRLVAQKINTAVFSDPALLVHNARLVERHVSAKAGGLRVVRHIPGLDGGYLYGADRDVRVLEYIPGSLSREVLENIRQAERAAHSFARFSRMMSDFDSARLKTVIPDFHSPALRWRQFHDAFAADHCDRAAECVAEIDLVLETENVLAHWQRLMDELPARVCHNDCKINNLLVCRDSGQPLAVIDLDTCMPGPVLADFGDLVRTCCSPEPEDSTRLDAVRARPEVYGALVTGYLDGWSGALTQPERSALLSGGMMMCFLVGLRFLTDYLDGDRYFAVSRPHHNLERARNQFALYRSLVSQRSSLEQLALAA